MAGSGKITTGGCLCGAVRYEVKGALRDVINCHLRQGYGSAARMPKL